MTPGQIFGSAVKGINIMTPYIITYEHVGHKIVVELSEGTGLCNDKLYGVTVVRKVDNIWKHDHDTSKCFHDYDEAINYINNLKDRWRFR